MALILGELSRKPRQPFQTIYLLSPNNFHKQDKEDAEAIQSRANGGVKLHPQLLFVSAGQTVSFLKSAIADITWLLSINVNPSSSILDYRMILMY